MNITERISRIVALGLYDEMTTPDLPENFSHYVAAGNPGKTSEFPESVIVPDSFKLGKDMCYKRDFNLYTVSGNSMSPGGILNGYELLTKPLVSLAEINVGDFILISVDDAFYCYRHKGRKSHFQQKLRKAIRPVSLSDTYEQLLESLVGTFAEAFTPKEKNDLLNSFVEARKFYKDADLFLSVTYHRSEIHYSFHPAKNVRSVVIGAAYKLKDVVMFADANELAS